MRTTISVSSDVFEATERLAPRTKKLRRQLFSDAIRDYVARHAEEEITEAMNNVCADVDRQADKFAPSAPNRTLKFVEW